jgi:hypothetical protein
MVEPRVICAIGRKWGNPACQPHGLIPINRNHSQYVQKIVIKYVITIVEISNIEIHEQRDSQTSINILLFALFRTVHCDFRIQSVESSSVKQT